MDDVMTSMLLRKFDSRELPEAAVLAGGQDGESRASDWYVGVMGSAKRPLDRGGSAGLPASLYPSTPFAGRTCKFGERSE